MTRLARRPVSDGFLCLDLLTRLLQEGDCFYSYVDVSASVCAVPTRAAPMWIVPAARVLVSLLSKRLCIPPQATGTSLWRWLRTSGAPVAGCLQ